MNESYKILNYCKFHFEATAEAYRALYEVRVKVHNKISSLPILTSFYNISCSIATMLTMGNNSEMTLSANHSGRKKINLVED